MDEPDNEPRRLGAEASRLLMRRGYLRLQIDFNSPDKVVKGHRNALQERRQEKTTPSRRRSSGQPHSRRRSMNEQDSPTKPKQDVPSFARIDSVLEQDGPTKLKQEVPSFARTDSVLEQEDCTTRCELHARTPLPFKLI